MHKRGSRKAHEEKRRIKFVDQRLGLATVTVPTIQKPDYPACPSRRHTIRLTITSHTGNKWYCCSLVPQKAYFSTSLLPNDFGTNNLFKFCWLRSKQQRVTHLLNMGVAEATVTKLLGILEKEGSPEHLSGVLKQMTKRKNQAASDIKQGKNGLMLTKQLTKLHYRCYETITLCLVESHIR